ncbi:MAG TPA: hypothetical protein VFB54_18530 [Burkholderiales bacterium]|nr:hypothetical protein [Burkholderiales bacterium]
MSANIEARASIIVDHKIANANDRATHRAEEISERAQFRFEETGEA